jgi:hypothetical protein
MIKASRIILFLLVSGISSEAIAQGIKKDTQGSTSLEFRDGVFINMGMLKKNRPIPSKWIETDIETGDRDFYRKITRDEEIVFFDDNGIRTRVATDSIWGYCKQGELHINIYGDFHRIDQIGRFSHFIARKATYVEYEVRGSHPRSISFLTFEAISNNSAYLVDMVNDKVLVFDVDRLEEVLESDPELWNEFTNLKKRKKEKMKYVFLQRFNRKYPLKIPFD